MRALIEAIEPRCLLSVLPNGFIETEELNGLASPTSMAWLRAYARACSGPTECTRTAQW